MPGSGSEPYRFPTTQWSAVEQAGAISDAQRAALSQLLPRYLAPLRAHLVIHKRIPAAQADDLLQSFLAEKVLEQNLIGSATRTKGRFRTFLLMALDRFVSNQLRNSQRLKRSPRAEVVPLEDASAVAVQTPTPSSVFEAIWARQVLSHAAQRMREECTGSNRADIWEIFETRLLAPTLDGAEPVPYEQLVARLGLRDEHAASNLLITAKRMFARSLRGVVGEYMGEHGEIDQEIAELREVLSRSGG